MIKTGLYYVYKFFNNDIYIKVIIFLINKNKQTCKNIGKQIFEI